MNRTILIITQVYAPDPAAVGQQITDVALEMARRGWQVCVYTAGRGYEDPSVRYPKYEETAGVVVRRLPFSSFGKRSLVVRLIAQVLFTIQAMLRGAFTADLQAIVVSTSPPIAGFAGVVVGWLRGVPVTWWVMDVNPDQVALAAGLTEKSPVVRIFRWMNRITLKRANVVITLDHFMADRLRSQSLTATDITVVPPWAKTALGWVDPNEGRSFREQHGLLEKFVVMYSGNHALQHPLATLLRAAKVLEGQPRIQFVFIGAGAGKAEIDCRIRDGARNLKSLPFQPAAGLRSSLGAADLHIVSLGDEVVGVVHPCKIYGAMAVGRPILFFGPQASHGGEILARWPVGWRVSHGEVGEAVRAITSAASQPRQEAVAQGRHAAGVIADHYNPATLRHLVCDKIEGSCDMANSQNSVGRRA